MSNISNTGIDKAPGHLAMQGGPHEQAQPPNIQDTQLCCGCFWTGSHSSERRLYFGSLLCDLGVMLLITVGGT
jgi:hypothetical protein